MRCFLIFILTGSLWSIQNAYCNDLELFQSSSEVRVGQALVIHGLNTQPAKMRSISDALRMRGFDVLQLSLEGHGNVSGSNQGGTFEIWRQQTLRALKIVNDLRNRKGGRLLFVGYSLGGLLGVDLINRSAILPDRMILFAPALAIRREALLLSLLSRLPLEMVIPSLSPREYRASKGITVKNYLELISESHRVRMQLGKAWTIPTTVFIDPQDEMVSFKEIRALIERRSSWSLVQVSNRGSELKNRYHHLIIDEVSLGQSEWQSKVLPVFTN